MVFSQAYTLLMSKHSGCGIRPMFYVSQQEAATLSLFNESLKSLSKESKQRPRKKTYSPQTEDGKKYYYFNKNISSFSLSSRSLSPFLSSHFFIFSSLSFILTFSFSLPFVSTATTLKVTVTVGHGSLLTGSHQLSLKKTQTSLSKNSNLSHQIRSLSAKLSRWWRRFASGLVVVVVA